MLNPFALPVHPAVVHFPMATLTLAWIFLLVRYATGDERWDGRARLFELVGVVALPFTIIAGFIDTRGIDFLLEPRADAPLIWHMTAALVASITFALHYLRRPVRPIGDVALATFGVIALLAAGLLAAEMVYGT